MEHHPTSLVVRLIETARRLLVRIKADARAAAHMVRQSRKAVSRYRKTAGGSQ